MADLKVRTIGLDQMCPAVNPDWCDTVLNTFEVTKFENDECLFDDQILK